jgi:hypothetical protein
MKPEVIGDRPPHGKAIGLIHAHPTTAIRISTRASSDRSVPEREPTYRGHFGWGGGPAQMLRIAFTAGAWVMKAMMRISAPQSAQRGGKIS